MSTLYRIIPYVAGAKKGTQGHPLFFPENKGVHRVDNQGHYQVSYFASDGSCAFAEKFAYLKEWNEMTLRPDRSMPNSRWALISYEIDTSAPIFDMDDAANLLKLGVRPSHVVTLDRVVTQAWALKVFKNKKFSGISWWSYFNSEWSVFGIWRLEGLSVKKVEILTLKHPVVAPAAEVTNKLIRI